MDALMDPNDQAPDGWPAGIGTTAVGRQKTLGWKRRSPAETAQSSSQRRHLQRPVGRGDGVDAAPDGSIDPESRALHPTAAPTGLLRFVCSRPPGGHHPAPEGVGTELAGESAEPRGRSEMAQSENASDGRSGGGTTPPKCSSWRPRRKANNSGTWPWRREPCSRTGAGGTRSGVQTRSS